MKNAKTTTTPAANAEPVPVRTITIADPESKATSNQLRFIGQAVKNGQYERLADEAWKNLTKGEASKIIDEIRTKNGEPSATYFQKRRFMELVKDGFLRGVKKETFKSLSSAQISRMIFKGMKNKEAGIQAEPYPTEVPAA